MSYKITAYSQKKAKELGVVIKLSSNPLKKIDVYKDGKKVASIGAYGMKDYPTYLRLEKEGKYEAGYAEKRRKLYKKRHEGDRHKRNTNSYYADKILW